MKKLLLAMMSFAALSLVTLVASADAVVYSNTTTFTGFAYSNGGAALQGTNTITRAVFDDLSFNPGVFNQNMRTFTFSVSNLNAVNVSARARVRFYADNANAPGTLLAAFSFAPISFTAGSVGLFTTAPANYFNLGLNSKIWAGISFDNNSGGTGATLAQLNNLGQGIFNPPTKGSSANAFFQSTAAGVFGNNPAGSLLNNPFGGNPVGNFGWAFTSSVQEPGSAGLICFGLMAMGLVRRRR